MNSLLKKRSLRQIVLVLVFLIVLISLAGSIDPNTEGICVNPDLDDNLLCTDGVTAAQCCDDESCIDNYFFLSISI